MYVCVLCNDNNNVLSCVTTVSTETRKQNKKLNEIIIVENERSMKSGDDDDGVGGDGIVPLLRKTHDLVVISISDFILRPNHWWVALLSSMHTAYCVPLPTATIVAATTTMLTD